jgi:inosose dehydratase
MTLDRQSRRQFLKVTAGAAALSGGTLTQAQGRASSTRRPRRSLPQPLFELGLASYTLRKFDLDQTLAMTKRVGLKNIAFKSMHLTLDSTPEQISSVVKQVSKANLKLYGAGVIYMKSPEEVENAFAYAKAAGIKVIIGVPSPELLPLVEKKVKQTDILIAIHNHGPGDEVYPLPETIYEKVKDLDKRIGICIDIGHTQRMGVDPGKDVIKYQDRIHDVHIKDVSAAQANGKTVEIGRGVIDIPQFIRSLIEIKYAGKVSFEYEKDANDPLAGLAESVGYVKGVIDTLT